MEARTDQIPDMTGVVMVGLDSTELTGTDRRRLALPAVGGVCLFSRNYTDINQLRKLIKQVRLCVPKPLVLAVDHEGGRVQRLTGRGFVHLKPTRQLGMMYQRDPKAALNEAAERGTTTARQLAAVDIDLCLAPVLDIDYRRNEMIGERCFADNAKDVTALAMAYCQGLAEYDMQAIGKHFPGHGWATEDSHFEMPVDGRAEEEIIANDMLPYQELIKRNMLAGVMLSHVHYSALTDGPGTFSATLVDDYLRKKLGFTGKVLTDDMWMGAIDSTVDMRTRLIQARKAGCDLLLLCGGEAVLFDRVLSQLPATDTGTSPWQALARK